MRKGYVALVAVLIIGLNVCPLRVLADVETTEATEIIETADTVDAETAAVDTGDGEKSEPLSEEMSKAENAGKLSLQIPQKLQVVIDPFEMDGKGQIYSGQYTIWNTGETAGTLTLSFSCRLGEDSSLELRQEKDGVHDGENKSVYLEMVFGDTERFILSAESSEYQAELVPGEGVTLYFTGEINEYASEQWKDGDIIIDGIYTWHDAEDSLSKETEDVKTDTDTSADIAAEETKEESSVSRNGLKDEAASKVPDESMAKEKVSGETKVLEENNPQEPRETQDIEGISDEILNKEVFGKDEEENGKEEKDDSDRRAHIDSGDHYRDTDLSAAPEG